MRQAELEKDKPSEYPKPFSIFGNRSVLTSDVETFKITDPLVAAIASCDKKLFLKLYDRVKKCRDGAEPGIARLNELYFYPLEDIYPRDPVGGYNIVTLAICRQFDDYVRPLTFWEEVIRELERPPRWRSRFSSDRQREITNLFKAAQTSEERERLVEEAPQLEKEFFTLAKERVENSLKSHQAQLINTRTFLGWEGYGKKINDLVAKIISKYPELEERVTSFKDQFNKAPISTCCQLLLTIYNSTDLCILTPDSCFTWAREKLTLIDVEMPDVGIESCISPTRCFLTPVNGNGGCCQFSNQRTVQPKPIITKVLL